MIRTLLLLGVGTLVLASWLAPSVASAADLAAGKEKFKLFCETCHGATGKGDGPGAAGIQPPPRDFSKGEFKFDANGNGKPGEDADLKEVISNGAAKYGGSPLMVAWGGTLTATDVENLVAVIRSLKAK
jgi:mono/diheme cytochrome c family protein